MTSERVLSVIKDINSRQRAPQEISIDTLLLALRVSLHELTPLIDELRKSRDIVFHPPKPSTSQGPKKIGSVSLA